MVKTGSECICKHYMKWIETMKVASRRRCIWLRVVEKKHVALCVGWHNDLYQEEYES